MQEIDSDIRAWVELKGRIIDGLERHEKAVETLLGEVKELRSEMGSFRAEMAFFRGALAICGFLLGGGVLTGIFYALLA